MTDKEKIAELETKLIEMQDLTKFVAMLWEKADAFIWESAKSGSIDTNQYPCVQGTSVRMTLHKIANEKFINKNVQKALESTSTMAQRHG
jgi:hypothetical protein